MRPKNLLPPVLCALLLASCRAAPAVAGQEPAGLDPLVKDWVEIGATAAGLVTIVLGVLGFLREARKTREQRVAEAEQRERQRRQDEAAERHRSEQRTAELEQRERQRRQDEAEWRWRKAELARELLDRLHANALAVDAMRMLDWDRREYALPGGTVALDRGMILHALRTHDEKFTPPEMYVRDCFDELFGAMERIQHYVEIHLVELPDVLYPFRYYVGRMQRHTAEYRDYLDRYGFRRAATLWDTLLALPDDPYRDVDAGRESVPPRIAEGDVSGMMSS